MYLHRSGFFFFLSVSLHFHKKIKRKRNRQLTTAYSTVSNTSGKTHLHVKRLGPKKKKVSKIARAMQKYSPPDNKIRLFLCKCKSRKKTRQTFQFN